MSAMPERPERRRDGLPEAGACPVCGTPVADVTERCPECGLDLAGVPPRPGAYSRAALVWTVVGFVIVYAVIVLVVALAN